MNLRFLAACLIIPCASAPLPAQQLETPQGSISNRSAPNRDATSIRLLDQLVAQSGFSSIRPDNPLNTTAQGTIVYSDGRSGTIVMKTLGASSFRNDTTISGIATSFVVSGDHGHIEKDGKRFSLPEWVVKSSRADSVPVLAAMSWLTRKELSIRASSDQNLTSLISRWPFRRLSSIPGPPNRM